MRKILVLNGVVLGVEAVVLVGNLAIFVHDRRWLNLVVSVGVAATMIWLTVVTIRLARS